MKRSPSELLILGAIGAVGAALVAFARKAEHGDELEASDVVERAWAEKRRWQGKTETDPEAAAMLRDYWATVGISAQSPETAWSAVFISFLADDRLEPNQAHVGYVRSAWADRVRQRPGRYWAYEPSEISLRPGDVVVRSRDDASHDLSQVVAGSEFIPSHGDVVVEVGEGTAEGIGGNESNTVGVGPIAVDAEGKASDPAVYAVLRVGLPRGEA